MIFSALSAYADFGLYLLRLVVAIIFIYHAWPKLLKTKMMAQMVGMPTPLVALLGLVEFLSSIGLILGAAAPLAASLLALVMVGAIGFKVVKWRVPFAAMDKTGWEFDLVLLAANIAIVLTGGGTIGLLP